MLPYYDLGEFSVDENILHQFRTMYQRYSNRKALAYISQIYEDVADDEFKEIRFSALDAIRDDLQAEFAEMNMSTMDALTYIKILSLSYGKFNWGFAWDLLDTSIIYLIQQKGGTIVPVEDENGVPYLGRKYILKNIPNNNNNEGDDDLDD